MSLDVQIVRSKRRKRTIQTKFQQGRLWIYLPFGMSRREEQKWIDRMIERYQKSEKRRAACISDEGLLQRAQALNKRYFNGALEFCIFFVSNQHSRFGSCCSTGKTIRISDRVRTMPLWVQDYIIMHELAHLLYPNHSKQFWKAVNQFTYAERAKGYLFAVSTTESEQYLESSDATDPVR